MSSASLRLRSGRFVFAAAASLMTACSSSDDLSESAKAPPVVDTTTPPASSSPIVLEWKPCARAPTSGKSDAECALVDLPRDHASPDGPRLRVAAKRVVPKGPVRAQVFLVDGGPGGSAVNAFAALGKQLLARGDVAVYAVDHRGMGGSTPLDCVEQQRATSEGGESITEEEWAPCIEELRAREKDNLPFLTTTQSMEDVAWMIERTRTPGVPVMVYGGSYGTYATIRYMKLHPEQADGIILEGISPPGRNFDPYDVEMDGAARELFARCSSDASCRAHFTDDPWRLAGEVVNSFDRGHCPKLGLDGDGARTFLGNFTFYSPLRDYLPMLVYRLQRCEPRDIEVLVHFYETYARLSGSVGKALLGNESRGALAFQDGRHVTDGAFFHVAISEMWHTTSPPPPASQVLADWRKLTMSTGLTLRIAKLQPAWPAYARGPEVDDVLPKFDRPMLMLQGALDAATAVAPARLLRDAYRAPGQTWAEFPNGAHQIVSATPTADGQDCGRSLLYGFVDSFAGNPRSALDTSCARDAAPLHFDGTPENNPPLLGVADAWDD